MLFKQAEQAGLLPHRSYSRYLKNHEQLPKTVMNRHTHLRAREVWSMSILHSCQYFTIAYNVVRSRPTLKFLVLKLRLSTGPWSTCVLCVANRMY